LQAESWRLAYRGALSDEFLAGDVVTERRQHWESRLSAPAWNQCVLVAHTEQGLTGFACAYGTEDREFGSYLNNLHVAQSMQGRGLGRDSRPVYRMRPGLAVVVAVATRNNCCEHLLLRTVSSEIGLSLSSGRLLAEPARFFYVAAPRPYTSRRQLNDFINPSHRPVESRVDLSRRMGDSDRPDPATRRRFEFLSNADVGSQSDAVSGIETTASTQSCCPRLVPHRNIGKRSIGDRCS
jgi:hypothetical protein